MKRLWIVCCLLVSFVAISAQEPPVDPYMEGQRLFQEGRFADALAQFEEADKLFPDEPRVLSWIGACLNQLGRHAEAKARMEQAFAVLREQQALAQSLNQDLPPIDLNYHALLAGIQTNLHEFDAAIATLQAYTVDDDGSETAAAAKQAFDGAKTALKAQIVSAGAECLRACDLDCARRAFTQAESFQPSTPPVVESIAKGALSQAERAPAETDEDKAKKGELYQTAVAASRMWLEAAGPEAVEPQRTLARALAGTKKKEGYEEELRILRSLWDGAPSPEQRDSSIQLELAAALAGLEQWEQVLASASTFIAEEPEDPLGQGYCMRSFAQYRLGRCPEAIDDGARCRNADGSPRTLKHVDSCKEQVAKQHKQQADRVAADREATLQRDCAHLYERIKWARSSLDVPIKDLLDLIGDLKSGESKCASYLEASERKTSGNGFSPATPELCDAGVRPASSPLNLSARTREDLQLLLGQTRQFLELCTPSLDAAQIQAVESGRLRVEEALARPQ